jgi:hypothetical protein
MLRPLRIGCQRNDYSNEPLTSKKKFLIKLKRILFGILAFYGQIEHEAQKNGN